MNIPVGQILNAFETLRHAPAEALAAEWIAPYPPGGRAAERHQFALFLKPEATAVSEGVNLGGILELINDSLKAYDAEVGAVRILSGDYLGTHRIMDQHYGVINRISKGGVEAISEGAKSKLQEVFGSDLEAGAQVLGGHQFLDEVKAFNALSLCVLNDNLGTTKLAGGTYVMRISVLGKVYLVLNPFHAFQLVPFTSTGRAIIVMEGLSSTPWATLRGELTGATDPAQAGPDSIRGKLLANKEALGLKEVTQGTNGVHLSAGPLEGMVEIMRFFAEHAAGHSLSPDATAFGRQLMDAGADAARVDALAANPDLETDTGSVSAFDLTEECDALESVARLLT